MRSYHVDIARHVTDAERKWIDNLLSHFDIPGVETSRRGVSRRIAPIGIYHIALAHQLVLQLGLPVKAAVALAESLMRSDSPEFPICNGLWLFFDRPAFQAAVDARLVEAVEAVVPARRGRPPSQP